MLSSNIGELNRTRIVIDSSPTFRFGTAGTFVKSNAHRGPLLNQLLADPFTRAALCILIAGLMLALRRAIASTAIGSDLRRALALIAAGLLFGAIDYGAVAENLPLVIRYLDALFFGAVAIGLARVMLALFVDLYLMRHGGAVVSAIFRDVVGLGIYFLIIVVVLRSTLEINVASLIATSAVLTAIIGLALQDVLANIFSGLVLELEQPFSRGDWVRVGSFEGVVDETGWRTTKIRTRVNELITLPNAMLSKEAVVNYSRPDARYGDTMRFQIALETPPSLVQQTVAEVFAADPAVLAEPALEVRLEHFMESGTQYAIRYWLTDFAGIERLRNRLHTNLWYAFRRAGVRLPFPARDVFVYPGNQIQSPVPADGFATLRQVPLLAPLTDEMLRALVPRVQRLTFGRAELVVREGDGGDSFYVIEKGTAEVLLGDLDRPVSIAKLSAGSFFGEMSLLAGEPRSATVRALDELTVLVIDRASFRDVIVGDPALIAPLSEIVSRRQSQLQEQREQLLAANRPPADDHHAHSLSERIRAFFGLGH